MSKRRPDGLVTDGPPDRPARRVGEYKPDLMLNEEHDLCPGCGEPIALRALLEAVESVGCGQRCIGSVGIGCYTALTPLMDVDLVQALHGRAPSVATGIKRMRPDQLVFTLQGDGDMVNEGLQEVLHAAARGESITCVLLNNGVFGETGGHMTATTVLGQRTKNTLEGRDASYHGHPIRIADLVAQLGGTVYAARCGVWNAKETVRTRRVLERAFQSQLEGGGFSFVEVLTMCPTGWFVPTAEGPDYLSEKLGSIFTPGELVRDGVRLEQKPGSRPD
ncbi:MAG: thiamine pyrophosphate-dependent enzyme [Myxococcota bacterium]